MEANDQKITFLPSEKGKNVAKIDLEKKINAKKENETETARAILFLPTESEDSELSESYVIEHDHAEIGDSELYCSLTKVTKGINQDPSLKGKSIQEVLKIVNDYSCPNNIRQYFHDLLKASSKVAGANSPTGDTKHGIAKSAKPQIYLAIKKSAEDGKWNQLESDVFGFFQNLDFDCKLKNNHLLVKSGKEHEEYIDIDTKENIIAYRNEVMENCVKVDVKNQVFNKIDIANENIKNAQQDLVMGM